MRIRIAFAALLLSLTAAQAQTAPAAPPAPPAQTVTPETDPAKVALATQILQDSKALSNMGTVLDALTPQIIAQVKQSNPKLSDDTLKQIGQLFNDEMRADIPALLTMEAQVYATHFSVADLQGIEKFYQSDVGKRMVAETPGILKENIPLGTLWGREAAQRALPKILDKLRAQGVKI